MVLIYLEERRETDTLHVFRFLDQVKLHATVCLSVVKRGKR